MEKQENIVVATFPEPSKAYQALSVLKQANTEGKVVVRQAAVIERTKDGRMRIPEGADKYAGVGTLTGSLIGMLIGVLGGPIGLLLGWGTGALIGGVFDVTRESTSETALALFGRAIAPGSTALIADVSETATEVLDERIQELGGQLIRRPISEVLAEIEAAEDAARAASEEAERVMREQRKVERKERREERLESLKAKLHRADEAIRSL